VPAKSDLPDRSRRPTDNSSSDVFIRRTIVCFDIFLIQLYACFNARRSIPYVFQNVCVSNVWKRHAKHNSSVRPDIYNSDGTKLNRGVRKNEKRRRMITRISQADRAIDCVRRIAPIWRWKQRGALHWREDANHGRDIYMLFYNGTACHVFSDPLVSGAFAHVHTRVRIGRRSLLSLLFIKKRTTTREMIICAPLYAYNERARSRRRGTMLSRRWPRVVRTYTTRVVIESAVGERRPDTRRRFVRRGPRVISALFNSAVGNARVFGRGRQRAEPVPALHSRRLIRYNGAYSVLRSRHRRRVLRPSRYSRPRARARAERFSRFRCAGAVVIVRNVFADLALRSSESYKIAQESCWQSAVRSCHGRKHNLSPRKCRSCDSGFRFDFASPWIEREARPPERDLTRPSSRRFLENSPLLIT